MLLSVSNNNRHTRHWFVMRVNKREKEAEEKLSAHGAPEFYIPKKVVVRTAGGRKRKELVPAIPSYIFVNASHAEIMEFKRGYDHLKFVTWDRTEGTRYLTVDDKQMRDFITVSSTNMETLLYMAPEEVNLAKGTRVRIHGGVFDGVCGTFLKVKGARSRRLVIMLDNIQAIAAEISPDLVEVIADDGSGSAETT